VPGFVPIPGGEFEMGDHHDLGGREHRSDEVPIHTVRVDSFYMAATETTNQQYCDYLNAAVSQGLIETRDGLVKGVGGSYVYCDTQESDRGSNIAWNGRTYSVREGRANHPVVCIRWHGAAAYCNWLSAQKGYEPCYDLSTWACDYTRKGFRLPSEAEWEYAGRGDTLGPYCVFPWGDEPDGARANWPRSGDPFEVGSYPWTTPVGFYNGKLHSKTDFEWPGRHETYQTSNGANGYGLFDMSGNVWEWVNDWYVRDYYASSSADNPPGPAQGQPMRDGKPYRVLRSGSWYNGQWGHGRVANRNPSYYRGPDDPDHRWYHIGFRVALGLSGSHRRLQDHVPASGRTRGAQQDDRRPADRRDVGDRGRFRDDQRSDGRDRGRGERGGGGRGPLMRAFDTDGDGELSTVEIQKAASVLRSIDRDRDGNVTVDELREQMRQDRGGRPGDRREGGGRRDVQDGRRRR